MKEVEEQVQKTLEEVRLNQEILACQQFLIVTWPQCPEVR